MFILNGMSIVLSIPAKYVTWSFNPGIFFFFYKVCDTLLHNNSPKLAMCYLRPHTHGSHYGVAPF